MHDAKGYERVGTRRPDGERAAAQSQDKTLSGNGATGGAGSWPPPNPADAQLKNPVSTLERFPPPDTAHAATAGTDGQTAAQPRPAQPDDPGRVVGPLEAVLHHKLLAVLPLLALVGAALVIVLARTPTYTAQSRLNVGRVDVPAYTLQGVVLGNTTLAVSYARAISAPGVVVPAARRTGLTPNVARDRLSASPVVGSTLIKIDATGPSASSSVGLANAAAASMTTYVASLNRDNQSTGILRDFQNAQRAVDRATRRARRAVARSGPTSQAATEASIALQSAQLKAQSIDLQYRGNLSNQPAPNLVQVIAPASTADSDFDSRLQEMLLIAVVAGIVLGMGLALLRANRHLLRRRG
jgi:capsular polysaccharide biosynthesis protein